MTAKNDLSDIVVEEKKKAYIPVDVKEKLKSGKISYGATRLVGYVTQAGKLYECGFKNEICHVSWKGWLVLVDCPKCKHHNSASEAVKGYCEKCGFNAESTL